MPSPALGSQPPEEAAVTRRSTELLMTAFALGLVALAFASAAFSLKGQHPSTIIGYIVAYAVIIIGAHLAMRKFAPYADPLLLPIGALLNGLGLVMIYRLHEVGRNGNTGPVDIHGNLIPITTLSSSAVILQIVYTVLGIGCFVAFLALIKEPRVLQRYTYILGLVGVILIALPAFLPSRISGVAGTGAKIQIAIPGLGSIQPEEFGEAGPGGVLRRLPGGQARRAGAGRQAGARHRPAPAQRPWPDRRGMGWSACCCSIFESDIGTSAVFMGLFVAMLYIATSRRSWVMIGFGMFVAGAFLSRDARRRT